MWEDLRTLGEVAREAGLDLAHEAQCLVTDIVSGIGICANGRSLSFHKSRWNTVL
jgi:hypothetical protein